MKEEHYGFSVPNVGLSGHVGIKTRFMEIDPIGKVLAALGRSTRVVAEPKKGLIARLLA